MKRARILDIITTVAFVIFFFGNLTVVQVFYVLFWNKTIGSPSYPRCLITNDSLQRNQPLLGLSDSETNEEIKNGATDVSYRFELGFQAGSILFFIFDLVLVLLISQNVCRPRNRKENSYYSIILYLLVFLGGTKSLMLFWSTVFTKSGKICAGEFLGVHGREEVAPEYRVTESQFVKWLTISEVSIFLILFCSI